MNWLRRICSDPPGETISVFVSAIAVITGIECLAGIVRKEYGIGDTLFWFFSASAQSIAAFVAFLLTGYALVLSIMDKLEANDETLADIHHNLKSVYYGKLKWLSFLIGASILGSLGMIFSKDVEFPLKYEVIVVVIALNASAVVSGIMFVLSMIDPDKYRKVAQEMLQSPTDGFPFTGRKVAKLVFIDRFIDLERLIRTLFETLPDEGRALKGRPLRGFREICDALLFSQRIDKGLYALLLEVSRYRNLVIHGEIEEVDEGMLKLLDDCLERLRRFVTE